jgi:hypothetical protein
MSRRTISTVHEPVACAVCGRTLLRGEHPNAFLHAGHRRTVCELCTGRAVHEGWIREGADDARAVRRSRRTRAGGGFFDRLRVRREEDELDDMDDLDVAAHADAPLPEDAPRGTFAGGEFHPGPPEPVTPTQIAQAEAEAQLRPDRNVTAIPTNADLKVARAMDVVNSSEHPRTVASIGRSLGTPFVCVRPSPTEGAVVTIVVGWELSWYRYEVDLSDEAAGVRVGDKGYELSELDAVDTVANAAADQQGYLHPAAAAA